MKNCSHFHIKKPLQLPVIWIHLYYTTLGFKLVLPRLEWILQGFKNSPEHQQPRVQFNHIAHDLQSCLISDSEKGEYCGFIGVVWQLTVHYPLILWSILYITCMRTIVTYVNQSIGTRLLKSRQLSVLCWNCIIHPIREDPSIIFSFEVIFVFAWVEWTQKM